MRPFTVNLEVNPEKNNLPGKTKKSNLTTSFFSNPLYMSNTTLMLNKIPFEKSSTIRGKVQFFVESGVVVASLVTYNVGYYEKDSSMIGSNSKFNPLSNGPEIGSGRITPKVLPLS